MAWNTSRPTPGSTKTFSTTMVPVIRLANCSPATVSTGIMALRSTCRHKAWRRVRPLARAVRTKSSRITSSTADRVTRARIAACTSASAIAGSTSAFSASKRLVAVTAPLSSSTQPGKPPALTHCRCTAKSRMSRMANQKLGMAMPSWLAAITPTSPSLLWCDAAYRPSASASTTVRPMASSASGSVTCSRSAINSAVGVS